VKLSNHNSKENNNTSIWSTAV